MAIFKMDGEWRFRYALSGGQTAFPTVTQPLEFTWNLTEFTAIKLSGYTMSYTRKSDGADVVMFNGVWSYASGYQVPLQLTGGQTVSEEFYWWMLSATEEQGEHSAGYTISFDTRGGEPVPDDIVGVTQIPALPVDISRSGYYFGGWSRTDAFFTPVREGEIIAGDLLLYAWWNSNLTFSVLSETGLFEYAALEVEQVNRVEATAVGNDRTLTIHTEAGTSRYMEYTAMALEGQQLLGWSDTVGGPVVIALGDNAYRARGDVSLYEVYTTDRPLDGTITLDLYANTAEPERVNKSSYLSPIKSLKGALRGDQSMLSPSITVYDDNVPRYNYARMPDFEGAPNTPRYYFIDTITSVGLHLWRLDMRCDVLMTWRAYIGALEALVERQEYDYDENLVDSHMPIDVTVSVDVVESETVGYDVTGSYREDEGNVVVVVSAPHWGVI